MINIISRAYLSKTANGPQKVVKNLIKGLDLIGYPYVINKRLDACEKLWIHDDIDALKLINSLDDKIKVVVGPNLYVVARQIPENIDLSRAVYLHPSKWVKDFWLSFGFSRCPVEFWPTGIDTNEYKESSKEKKFVLIYFKQRAQDELDLVKSALENKRIDYKIVVYGQYDEQDYKKLLDETRYVIWLGRQESQGIALQEALATNTPILVCDVNSVGHWVASAKEMAFLTDEENNFTNTTSAAYFDERCGIKIKDLSEINEAISAMESKLSTFRPRQYILENLGLEKQARDLLFIYEKYFGLTIESGKLVTMAKAGNWKNNKLYFKLGLNLKNFIKSVLKK